MLNIIIVWFVLFVLYPGDVLVTGKESIQQLENYALTFDQIFVISRYHVKHGLTSFVDLSVPHFYYLFTGFNLGLIICAILISNLRSGNPASSHTLLHLLCHFLSISFFPMVLYPKMD